MNGRVRAVATAVGVLGLPSTACTHPDAVQPPPGPAVSSDSSASETTGIEPGGSTGGDDDTTSSTPDESSSSGGSSGEASDGSSSSTGGEPESGWSIDILDQRSTVAGTTSIDLDADGRVHVAYLDVNGGNDQLKYARLEDGEWLFETIDVGRTGWHCSLRVDPSGTPHVTHYAFSAGDLRYSSRIDGTWVTEVVDSDGFVGRKSSLRFTAQGNPRISYHDTSNDDLKFAARDDAGWVVQTVDAVDSAGDHTSLVLDSLGRPHIVYYLIVDATGENGGDLRYASRDDSGDWGIATIDGEGVVGSFAAMAIASDDTLHVSYRDDSNGRLKYAVGPGAWEIEVVDNDGNLGDFNTSIAVDAEDRPHVSYYDSTAGELRVATRGDDGWAHVSVDDELFSGHYSSLHIDDAGTLRLSYSFRHDDAPNPVGPIGLKYAEGRP